VLYLVRRAGGSPIALISIDADTRTGSAATLTDVLIMQNGE